MDRHRFDSLTRSLGAHASRRSLGLMLTGGSLTALVSSVFGAPNVDAKKKRHKKKGKKKDKKTKQTHTQQPQPVFNQFGCAEVGQPCFGDNAVCCSGICEGVAPENGEADTRRCAAHGLGSCSQDSPGACTANNPGALRCNNEINCLCLRTTAGSNFCADLNAGNDICAACAKDADCAALGYPAGSACAPIADGTCAGTCAGGMACVGPCGTAPRVP